MSLPRRLSKAIPPLYLLSAGECCNISLLTLSVVDPVPIACSWTLGLGDLLDLDKARSW
jgi:hypothetical protein